MKLDDVITRFSVALLVVAALYIAPDAYFIGIQRLFEALAVTHMITEFLKKK